MRGDLSGARLGTSISTETGLIVIQSVVRGSVQFLWHDVYFEGILVIIMKLMIMCIINGGVYYCMNM